MPSLKQKMMQGGQPDPVFAKGSQLADLLSQYVDEPNLAQGYSNPTYGRDPRFAAFQQQFQDILPGAQNTQQFGSLQNPPQYRGIRLILPQSMGGYEEIAQNPVPGHHALHQAFLGEMIRRGYPVLGGTGQFFGREPGFNPIGFGAR